MYKLIGIETGKVYAEGTKQECFRKLQSSNPTKLESPKRPTHGRENLQIYPEPLKIIRRNK